MVLIVLICALVAQSLAFTFTAVPATDLQPLFTARPTGWTGADVGFSFRLDNERHMWLFGDTLVGHTRDGKRTLIGDMFPRNTIATVRDTAALPLPSDASFFWRWTSPEKTQPDSFFKAPPLPSGEEAPGPSKTNWLWVFSGLVLNNTSDMYLLAGQFKNISNGGPFGFEQVSTTVLTVKNVSGDPLGWQYQADYFQPTANVSWGDAMVQDADPATNTVWILGNVDASAVDGPAGTVVTRITPGNLTARNWAAREYLQEGATVNDRQWVPGPIATSKLARLYSLAGETTLQWHNYLGRWFTLYFNGFGSSTIVMMSTNWLEHEWTQDVVYNIPAPFNDGKKYFCYAVKAHPELARAPNEIAFTYETNAYNFADVLDNAEIYVPRFVRVTIGK